MTCKCKKLFVEQCKIHYVNNKNEWEFRDVLKYKCVNSDIICYYDADTLEPLTIWNTICGCQNG